MSAMQKSSATRSSNRKLNKVAQSTLKVHRQIVQRRKPVQLTGFGFQKRRAIKLTRDSRVRGGENPPDVLGAMT